MPLTLFAGLRATTSRAAIRDAVAGVSLASMSVPQVLGYARIAGMPVVTGLYAALLPVLGFAIFGSSRHLVVSADSATAAILAGSLGPMATPEGARYLALAGMVALLTAGLLLVARLFKLGFLADFLSRTVLVGFLTGVGLQVAVAMLGDMVGVTIHSARTPVKLWEVLRGIPGCHVPTLALSAVVAGSILAGRRLFPRVPVALLVAVGAIAASAKFSLGQRGFALIGPVAGGTPSLGLPQVTWHEALATLPVAAACFFMIVAQSAATSRAFAERLGERVDEDGDLLGLSAANAAAGVSGAFVVNGSPTQTAMAAQAGSRSQVAQLSFAGTVLVVLLALTGPLQFLPCCILASVVFTIAVGMIDLAGLRDIRRESPGEFSLAVLTAAAVVAIGVEQGILLAIALSLGRHVRHSYRPHTAVFLWYASGQREWVPATPGAQTEPGLIVYHFGADIFYANVGRFADEVRALVDRAPVPVRWFVVDASAITDIDYTGARSLRILIGELQQRAVALVFARVSPDLRSDMDRHGITAAIGEASICGTLHEAFAAAHGGSPDLVPR
ncbi:MAG TPA: SulP family inorganic anion transporter [Anaeromyxobacteraceae bacterium]|nr:SulP family inorganic anion transporter [Anaeromyxobacteraceae bacterium]